MANELNIGLSTGLTVTVLPILNGVLKTVIPLTEVSTYGLYTGTMTGVAGTYMLIFFAAGIQVGYGVIEWDGVRELRARTHITWNGRR